MAQPALSIACPGSETSRRLRDVLHGRTLKERSGKLAAAALAPSRPLPALVVSALTFTPQLLQCRTKRLHAHSSIHSSLTNRPPGSHGFVEFSIMTIGICEADIQSLAAPAGS